ncbi:galaxin [Denticeps clupeoides]|uniref:galaxin n=1 Tax=Denticeps clupeoides TaxID=299321 RepID=UPI0010A2EDE8|nr:galaxin-like [Denticeps clupeoides]XP_028818918.1 galaxin-like [Denticeps clupeoides]XP_028818919.1 galaxin-like [Denticeps clupeoides]
MNLYVVFTFIIMLCDSTYPVSSKSCNDGPDPVLKCCGGVVINTTTHLCCGRHGHKVKSEKMHNGACCGNTSYDRIQECCCSSGDRLEVKPRELDSDCCKQDVLTVQDSTYPVSSKSCNDGPDPVLKCCGGVVINTTTHLCCGRHGHKVKSEKMHNGACCGNTSYDRIHECCCSSGDRLEVKPRELDSDCCKQDALTVQGFHLKNLTAKICHKNVVLGTVANVSQSQGQCSAEIKSVLLIQGWTIIPKPNFHQPLGNCSLHLMKQNQTYLWAMSNGHLLLISDLSSMPSPVYSVLFLCRDVFAKFYDTQQVLRPATIDPN